jgi:hypothetical protein
MLMGKERHKGIVTSRTTTYNCARSGGDRRHGALVHKPGWERTMVSNPPPRPPGRNPSRSDQLWCAEHNAWATLRPNGKYLCPFGHTLKRGKAKG